MANPTTLSIANGASTPVAINFTPQSVDPMTNIVTYVDKSGGIPLGYRTVKLQLVEPKGNAKQSSSDRVYRVRYWITIPVMETLSTADNGFIPAPTVAYKLRHTGEYSIPERATLDDRKDLGAFAKNLLANAAVVTTLVANLEGNY